MGAQVFNKVGWQSLNKLIELMNISSSLAWTFVCLLLDVNIFVSCVFILFVFVSVVFLLLFSVILFSLFFSRILFSCILFSLLLFLQPKMFAKCMRSFIISSLSKVWKFFLSLYPVAHCCKRFYNMWIFYCWRRQKVKIYANEEVYFLALISTAS